VALPLSLLVLSLTQPAIPCSKTHHLNTNTTGRRGWQHRPPAAAALAPGAAATAATTAERKRRSSGADGDGESAGADGSSSVARLASKPQIHYNYRNNDRNNRQPPPALGLLGARGGARRRHGRGRRRGGRRARAARGVPVKSRGARLASRCCGGLQRR
jgi:hypothetical protein